MEVLNRSFTVLWRAFLFQWPYAFETSIFFRQLLGASKVRERGEMFWFYSMVLMVVTCFAGGTLSRLLMAKPPVVFTNDYLIPLALVCWTLINRFPNDAVYKALKKPLLKEICVVMTEMYRGNSMLNTIELANRSLPASRYYPTPVFGPILLGVIATSSGNFMPWTVGLKNIKTRVPWNIQCGVITAVLYHLTVHDDYIVGSFLRNHVFGPQFDRLTARFIVVSFFVTMGLLQSMLGPHTNPFSPLHRVLYKVTNTETAEQLKELSEGQKKGSAEKCAKTLEPPLPSSFHQLVGQHTQTKEQKATKSRSSTGSSKVKGEAAPTSLARRTSEVERDAVVKLMKDTLARLAAQQSSYHTDLVKAAVIVLVPLAACCLNAFYAHPSNVLADTEVLRPGDYLAHCTYMSAVRGCSPRILLFQEDGVLAEYEAASPREARGMDPIWTSSNLPRDFSDGSNSGCLLSASIENFALNIFHGSEILWTAPKLTRKQHKKLQDTHTDIFLRLGENGLALNLHDSYIDAHWGSKTPK